MTRTFEQLRDIEHLETDEHLSRSVVRSIEIIGEATKALPKSLMLQYEDISWSEIARMRDNLIHRYFGVRYDIVWQVMKEDVPFLQERIPLILADVYRDLYLGYKEEILSHNGSSAFSMYLDLEIDRTVANTILREYDLKYRQTAIAKAKDILSQSDFARQLGPNEKDELEFYLQETIERATRDLSSISENPNMEL